MTMALLIRDARETDEAAWRTLWAGYLAFYGTEVSKEVTAFTWARILDPASRVSMRVAEEDGRLLGFAIHHYHDSTWDIAPEGYLEDLFVDGAARGKGVGRALIEGVYERARMAGSPRVYWQTHKTNHTAMQLYDKVAENSGFVVYRKLL